MVTDNFHHKNKKNKPLKNRSALRILILTEGETEQIYFSGLKNHHRLSNVDVLQCTWGTNAANIYAEACSIGRKEFKAGIGYTHIFCVFDLDTAKTTNAFGVVETIYAKKHTFCSKMHAIVSNPCFDAWYLLHFLYSCAPFAAQGNKTIGNVVKSKLDKEWKNAFNTNYNETISNTYQTLLEKSQAGHTNADRLLQEQQVNQGNNPITNVHELVKFLETLRGNPKPELNVTRISAI